MYGTLAYETKEEVMEWMFDIQLGQRNLTPIQKIEIYEKRRKLYERIAKAKQSEYHGNQYDSQGGVTPNLGEVQNNLKTTTNRHKNETNAKLASQAGVGTETYRKGKKILDSDNETIKQKVKSGEMSIDAGYKELVGKTGKKKVENNNESITLSTIQTTTLVKEPNKPIVENGVILIEEKTDDDKMMNDIARRMKWRVRKIKVYIEFLFS